MTLSRIAFTAALLLSSAATVGTAWAADPPAANATGGGMMRGMFTPEERMMMFVDFGKATAGMTDEQKHAYRQDRRARIVMMSEADRTKMKADLDARWAALTPAQKADITAKMQAWRAAHQNGAGGAGQ